MRAGISRQIAIAGVASWLLFGHGSALAGLYLEEPFSEPVGGRPDGWTWVDYDETNPTIFENIIDGTTNALRLGRHAVLFYEPSGGADPASDMYADLHGSIIINTGSMFPLTEYSGIAVLVRSNQLADVGSGDPEESVPGTAGEPGYKIVLAAERDDHYPFIAIYPGTNNHIHMTEDREDTNRHLGTAELIDEELFTAHTDYRFEFSAIGSTITAALWTLDEEPVLLASTSLTDAEFTDPGYFGLMGTIRNRSRFGYVRDLSVVPEPGTVSLLALAMGLLGYERVRRVRGST